MPTVILQAVSWAVLLATAFYATLLIALPASTNSLSGDMRLVANLKESCESHHNTKCEISVFYLPVAKEETGE